MYPGVGAGEPIKEEGLVAVAPVPPQRELFMSSNWDMLGLKALTL